eukprot:Awhi_evm1s9489
MPIGRANNDNRPRARVADNNRGNNDGLITRNARLGRNDGPMTKNARTGRSDGPITRSRNGRLGRDSATATPKRVIMTKKEPIKRPIVVATPRNNRPAKTGLIKKRPAAAAVVVAPQNNRPRPAR